MQGTLHGTMTTLASALRLHMTHRATLVSSNRSMEPSPIWHALLAPPASSAKVMPLRVSRVLVMPVTTALPVTTRDLPTMVLTVASAQKVPTVLLSRARQLAATVEATVQMSS